MSLKIVVPLMIVVQPLREDEDEVEENLRRERVLGFKILESVGEMCA